MSHITEEKSFDDIDNISIEPWWRKKATEMEIISSIYGAESLTDMEQPSETELGSFTVRVEPNCGTDVIGCSVELTFYYQSEDSI